MHSRVLESGIETDVKPYPKLMKSINSGLIVLFNRRKVGTVVFISDGETYYNIGEYAEDWLMDGFVDIVGVTIRFGQ